MTLTAIKNENLAEKTEEKKQTIIERYDRFAADILENQDSLMTRMLQGHEKVTKEEIENQQNLMKVLKSMSETIRILKQTGRLPDDMGPSDEFNDMGKMLEKVKAKKNSVSEIVQKLDK